MVTGDCSPQATQSKRVICNQRPEKIVRMDEDYLFFGNNMPKGQATAQPSSRISNQNSASSNYSYL
jgi:hypothetical protein